MTYAPAVVLVLPISDPAALPPFVEKCVKDRVSLVAVCGSGCQAIETEIDELRIGDGSKADARFFCTTAHADEQFEEAIEFAKFWASEDGRSGYEILRL
ncbi:hypothetical protein [Brevundimonas sp.]|uniref:hypothetical protein n=1 Tax=Brevundimonas sp. TaxID=1871086 RepID=UPI003D0DB7B4